jgi:hypothetical protein
MNETIRQIARLLSEVILPRLQSVQSNQAEQIAANSRLQRSIDELRLQLENQFATLSSQLTACRAELAAAQAMLKAAQMQKMQSGDGLPLVH